MTLTLHESAARLGAFCWIERRLFEVLGGSLGVLSQPDAKVLVDRHATHAAWRGQQWWERLPVLAQVDREELLSPETPGVGALYGALCPPRSAEEAGSGERLSPVGFLAGIYRVALPRLGASYATYRALTSPVSDAPARRTLSQVEADLEVDRAEGESFVHSLLDCEAAIDEAAAAVARLERLLLV
ncbi:MAG: hypothetical protein J2P58_06175 [Acidimicrobiaceae bacterium]|nr:hypothetical protein [Acidimicrobiaceae bacterium]MBO0748517.1 hypothetical protein [Acidimicrobiaceae bacterium]